MNTETLSSSVNEIRHKLPIPLRIVLGFGVVVFIIGLQTTIFETKQYDIAAMTFIVGGGLMLLIYTNHSGYRIPWDDNQVYMRNWGFRNLLFERHPYHAMTFDEMADIKGSSPANPGPSVTQLMPYQSLEITSREPNVESISIYASGLDERDLADFLMTLHHNRPDIFPNEVLKRMRKNMN